MKILFFLCLLVVPGHGQSAGKPTGTRAKAVDAIKAAQARLSGELKDPESARYRNFFVTREGAICGEYNAKNAVGGYNGFRRAIVTTDRVMLEEDKPVFMDYRWEELCSEGAAAN